MSFMKSFFYGEEGATTVYNNRKTLKIYAKLAFYISIFSP